VWCEFMMEIIDGSLNNINNDHKDHCSSIIVDHIVSISQEKIDLAVANLFKSGIKLYFSCTGAGAGLTNLIWRIPGASSTLIGSEFPYHQREFDRFVDRPWKDSGHSYCSKEASIALAQASYLRAQETVTQSGTLSPCIGVGLSATVATNRELKGGTRMFVALRTNTKIETAEIRMEQRYLGREGDGKVCDILALNMILHEVGIDQIPLVGDLN